MEYEGDGAAHAAPVAAEGVGVYGEGCGGGGASIGLGLASLGLGLSVSGVPQTSSTSAEGEMALVGEGQQQLVPDARANSTPAAAAAGASGVCVSFTHFTAALCANSTPAAPAAGVRVLALLALLVAVVVAGIVVETPPPTPREREERERSQREKERETESLWYRGRRRCLHRPLYERLSDACTVLYTRDSQTPAPTPRPPQTSAAASGACVSLTRFTAALVSRCFWLALVVLLLLAGLRRGSEASGSEASLRSCLLACAEAKKRLRGSEASRV
jgi:hypothetical protein